MSKELKKSGFPDVPDELKKKIEAENTERKAAIEAEIAKQPTVEQMRALLQRERQAREKRATERIKAVLEEEKCAMNPVMTLTPQGIRAMVEITALD